MGYSACFYYKNMLVFAQLVLFLESLTQFHLVFMTLSEFPLSSH
jgi:hypothetical protein